MSNLGQGYWVADLDAQTVAPIITVCVILIGLVVLLAVAVMLLRRWLKGDVDLPAGGFQLSDLRALHKQGKISNEEFEKTRGMIVAAAKKASEASEKSKPAPPAAR